ncbi:PEP-CTERM sorting domain-containing protein [Lacipirellula sp.]|uniref:PEP-CTERM sorting domain-containing protein n=1 Tax=Lacipirellula sp. TaxID=2691419 RepID=UPI003D125E0E
MIQRRFSRWASSILLTALASSANAAPYFTDGFDYADGSLVTNSAGSWVSHSGTAAQLQVTNNKADVVFAPTATASEDINRAMGATLAPGSTLYYGASLNFEDTRATPGTGSLGTTYFMHFKDSGTFNFRGRLYMTAGSTPGTFKLGITSSSGNLATTWGSDLSFGTQYTVMVSYTASLNDPRATLPNPLDPPNTMPNPGFTGPLTGSDGYASLWVNPVNASSTKVTDTAPPENVATDLTEGMSSLALRQGGNGPSKAHIDTVSIGLNFDEVLAAVGGSPATFSPADFDHDGFVDADDLATWKTAYGSTAAGDANNDNVTDGADFLIWQRQFTGSTPPVASVPEPATLSIGLAAAVGLVAASRRRRAS